MIQVSSWHGLSYIYSMIKVKERKEINRVATNAGGANMHDLTFNNPSFSSTSIMVKAITETGLNLLSEMFGNGAVSVELPKSKAGDFSVFATRKGLSCEWV